MSKQKIVGKIENKATGDSMVTVEKGNKTFQVLKFNAQTFNPESKTSKKLQAVTWGRNNEYSKFLKTLYNEEGNPLHRNSIDMKVRLIAGNEIKLASDLSIKGFKKQIKLISKNYEIFNCYAILVGYNRAGELSTFKSINIEQLAFYFDENTDEKGFWVSRDFKKHTRKENEPEFYPEFDPEVRDKLSIYFYSDEDIDWKYPEFNMTPVYNNGKFWIRQSYVAGKYQLDNMTSGFEGSYLINFPTGIPSEDEQDENFKDFIRAYTGEGAQKIIMTYTEPDGEQPTIVPVPSDNNDQKFLETIELADIITVDAHQIPIPMMILRGGTLSGTEERDALLREFQLKYINPRQRDLEEGINEILKTVNNKIELGNYITDENNEEIVEE